MKTYMTCVPCVVRQALEAAQLATTDTAKTEEALRQCLRKLADLPFDKTPTHISTEIHRIVRAIVKTPDPYKGLKNLYNEKALEIIPRLRDVISCSPCRIETAVRLAIAGNIIDFGHLNSTIDISLDDIAEETLQQPFSVYDLDDLRQDVALADRILYLADNAGEIVFDRLLIEEIEEYSRRVVLGVRGFPVLNDATLDDARQAGLSDLVRVVENGSDAPGTILEECSERFRDEFKRADLIIAKGQGNYETLSEAQGNIYFLLKVKCPAIALDMGCGVGDIVVARRGKRPLGDEKDGSLSRQGVTGHPEKSVR